MTFLTGDDDAIAAMKRQKLFKTATGGDVYVALTACKDASLHHVTHPFTAATFSTESYGEWVEQDTENRTHRVANSMKDIAATVMVNRSTNVM